MTRWMHPPQLERQRERDRFDPVVEGARYALSREVSLAIWKRVSEDATDSVERRDMEQAQQRFHELAARIAARGGRLRPDVGRVTRVGVEINGDSLDAWGADELHPRTPGRETLVAVEARRWARRTGEASMAGERSGLVPGKVDEEMARCEPPGASEVAQAMAALQARGREGSDMQPAPMHMSPSTLTTHVFSARDGVTPSASGPVAQRPSLDLLEQYRAPAVKEVLRRIGANHRLRQELIAATANPVRSVAGTTPWSGPLPSIPMTNGHALWQVTKRHAATLYRRAVSGGAVDQHDPAVESALQKRGTGQPLPTKIRREMERELGVSLAGVRVHTDAVAAQAARALDAEAFTLGEDIFFAEGMFDPDTRSGRKLLAHELTHVAQALRGDARPTGDGLRVSQPGETLEQEANEVASHLNETEPNEKTILEHEKNNLGAGGMQRAATLYQIRNRTSTSNNIIFRHNQFEARPLVAEIMEALTNNDVAAVFRLLRDSTSITKEEQQAIVTLFDLVGKAISDDDRWLAERLLASKISDSIVVSSDDSSIFTDPDPDPDSGDRLIQTEVHYVAGRSNRRALVIGGVHGSEPAGAVVVQQLIEALKKAKRKPFFTVVLVPKLIDKSRQIAKALTGNNPYREVNDPTAKGSAGAPSEGTPWAGNTDVEPNRNFQLAGKSYATYTKGGIRVSGGSPTRPDGRPSGGSIRM